MEGSGVLTVVIFREVPGVLLRLLIFPPSLLLSFSSLFVQAEIIMMDNFTVVFRSGSDAHFYVVGDGNEVRTEGGTVGGRKKRLIDHNSDVEFI